MTASRPPIHALICLVSSLFLAVPAMSERLTLERLFAAPDLSGPSLRGAQLTADGRRVTYLRGKDTDKDRFDLWAYDIAGRRHAMLVDSSALQTSDKALSAEEEARRERQRTSAFGGILEYEVANDGRRILIPLGGDLYVYDLEAPPARAVRRITNTASYETDARFSPKATYVSFIRDANVMIIELASGKETSVTRDGGGTVSFGMAEFIAQEEMDRTTGYWWSPDESAIAFTRVDESTVDEVQRFQIEADGVTVTRQRYPAAGTRNALVELFVAKLGSNTASPVKVDLGANTDIYLARVDWFPNSKQLAVQRQSRDQRTLTLLRADTAAGATRELVTERSDTWVDLHDELTFLTDTGDFLWASTRTGYRHLYAYDADGKLLRAVTQGEWMVSGDSGAANGGQAVHGVDRARSLVYFSASLDSPLERHLYAVSWRSPAKPKRITTGAGWHATSMSRDGKLFLDAYSSPTQPRNLALRDVEGRELAMLVANKIDASHPYAPYLADHVEPTFGTLPAKDGQAMQYMLLKPKTLEAGKRYPVIVEVYGGPGVQRVRRSWGDPFHQWLVQAGYVVFMLDNRGSGLRGVRFESALYHDMGRVETEDQVAGAEYLRTLPFVDPKRIGIWGWSYGGYMALNAMTRAPGTFAAGVAGAPVTDWSLYDTHYTERFMGTPAQNPEGYVRSRVMTHAANLADPLLVIHGMADDNVLFTHSTSLFSTLQKLNKPFDAMPYPGGKHGLIRHADMGPHALAMVKRFFDENLRATD